MAFCRQYDLNPLEPVRELLALLLEDSPVSAGARSTRIQSGDVNPSENGRDEDRIGYHLESCFEACQGPLWPIIH